MHGFQHKRMGVAAGIGVVAYSVLADKNTALALCMVTTPIGAMLPDIDHDRSKLGSTRKKVTNFIKFGVAVGIGAFIVSSYMSGGLWNALLNGIFLLGMAILVNIIESNKHIKKQLGFITRHRGIMHTLVPPIFLMGTTLWTSNTFYDYSIYGLCIGYVIHLLGDMATVTGVPLLWPILKKDNIRYFAFDTSRHKTYIELVCNIWCIIFVALGIYLGIRGGL